MTKDPTKILMIMYGKSVGGAELQFIELANFLAENHAVRLITLGGDGAVRASTLNDKIELRVISYSGLVGTLLGLMNAFLCGLTFNSRYIVTTSFSGNVIGYACSLIRTSKLISLQTVSKCMRHPKVDRFILKKFDLLIAGARDIKDYLIAHGQRDERIVVIHNWVDFSKRISSDPAENTKEKLGISGCTVIGCIGRLHPQKGQIYLIRAFKDIVRKYPQCRLVLVGDGPDRDTLEREVLEAGLADSIIFAGTVVGHEYNNYLQMFDIYVQPSVFEGLPRTLLDAMYMAKPVLATSINGNREAIENEVSGLLVQAENVDELKKAIMRVIESKELRDALSNTATQVARDRFDMQVQLKNIKAAILQ